MKYLLVKVYVCQAFLLLNVLDQTKLNKNFVSISKPVSGFKILITETFALCFHHTVFISFMIIHYIL